MTRCYLVRTTIRTPLTWNALQSVNKRCFSKKVSGVERNCEQQQKLLFHDSSKPGSARNVEQKPLPPLTLFFSTPGTHCYAGRERPHFKSQNNTSRSPRITQHRPTQSVKARRSIPRQPDLQTTSGTPHCGTFDTAKQRIPRLQ